jgi:hypothetical protein
LLLALCLVLLRAASRPAARRDSVILNVRHQPHPVARAEARLVHRAWRTAGG